MSECPCTKLGDRAAQTILIAALVACATFVVRESLDWLLLSALPTFWHWWSEGNQTAPRDLIVTIGGIVTLTVAIWRTWITNTQARAQVRQAEGAFIQAETARTQAQIAWRGQLADRFIKSAPLIAGENISQRTIALFALEEIATQSDEHAWGVVELVAAFVRERISIGVKIKGGAGEALGTAQTDVAQALDVIGRLNRVWDTPSKFANLASCDLSKYYLRGNFSRVAFNHCKFQETTFAGCTLAGAAFFQVGIESLRFSRCTGPIEGDIRNLDEINSALDGQKEFVARPADKLLSNYQNSISAASGNLTISSATPLSWIIKK